MSVCVGMQMSACVCTDVPIKSSRFVCFFNSRTNDSVKPDAERTISLIIIQNGSSDVIMKI